MEENQKTLFGKIDDIRTTLWREHDCVKEQLEKVHNRIEKAKEKKEDLQERLKNIEVAIDNLPKEDEEENEVTAEVIESQEEEQGDPF